MNYRNNKFLGMLLGASLISLFTGCHEEKMTNDNSITDTVVTASEDSNEMASSDDKPEQVFITFRPEDVRAETDKNVDLNPDELAKYYAYEMGLSKQNAYNLMTSAQFDNLPEDESRNALDALDYDWTINAVKKAKEYSNQYHFSAAEICDLLSGEERDGFTKEEAEFASLNSDIDYKENALYILKEYAEQYPHDEDFYYQYLTETRKFTQDEAKYALSSYKKD